MRKCFQFGILLLLLFSLTTTIYAQQKTVTGTIRDDSDKPLAGVNVSVKGIKTGTITNDDGIFSIIVSPNDVLEFSFVGYETVTRKVGSENIITLTLQKATSILEDVVVVGYGTQRRGNLTGAVSTIDVSKNIQNRPVADVGRAMQGGAAGLSITLPSGEVGSDPLIKIRGSIGSFQGGASPLILLDNVEIPSIQLVNPNDIADITILKDAAAASIYGAKASFGVILITTKKGARGSKPQITYTNNFSWQNVWKDLEMAGINAMKYTVTAAERVGTFTPTGAFYLVDRNSYERAVEWHNKYGNTIGPNDPTVFGRDWYVQGAGQKMGMRTYDPYDYMIKEWPLTQQHNISAGFTAGKTSYNLGVGLLDQSGMMKPAKSDRFTRHNASVRVSSEINKYLTVRGGALYSRRNKEFAYVTAIGNADPWLYLYRWSPQYPQGYDENGDLIRGPYSEAASANTANLLQNYLNVSLGATLNITKNWQVEFDYTYSNQDEIYKKPGTRYTARDSWSAPLPRFDAGGNRVYVNSEGLVVPSSTPGAIAAFDLAKTTYTAAGTGIDHFRREAYNFFSNTINAYTTYNLNLKSDHRFKFMAGLNRVASENEWQWGQILNLTNIDNPQWRFGIGTVTGDGNKTWEAQLGYFGRINYAFQNKYLLEANLRYDGSSKFPNHLKWNWFPSFSAGWVASSESFMNWMKPVVNSLKFRASWGSIGDQSVPNNLYVPTMAGGQSTWIGSTGTRIFTVGSPTAVASDIKWQDIVTTNFGVDLGLFNNKLTTSFEIFKRNTNNMIVPLEGIPLTFGIGAPQSNYGSLQTKGWELTLSFNHRFANGLGITVGGNIGDAKTTLTDFGASGTTVTGNYTGKTIGEIWGYRTDRLYQLDDFELDANGNLQLITLTTAESALYAGRQVYKLKTINGKKPVYQAFLQTSANFRFGPGDVKFRDINGDGELNNGANTLANHGDLEVIGNSNPRYEYGFRLGADYKGFDIGLFFQGVGSRQMWGEGSLAIAGYHSGDGGMPEAIAGNFWTPETPNAFYPAAYNNAGSGTANNMAIQDRYLLNMAYLRLKNLTVGYSFPKSLLSKASISSMRVYVGLENFITWDNLRGLPIDPESINGVSFWPAGSNLSRTSQGIPAFKSVSVGLQLNF